MSIKMTTGVRHSISPGDKLCVKIPSPWWKFWRKYDKEHYWVSSVDSSTTMTTRDWRWYDTLSHFYWRIKCYLSK